MRFLKDLATRKPIFLYIFFAFAQTWVFGLLAAHFKPDSMFLFYSLNELGAFGPVLGAIAVSWLRNTKWEDTDRLKAIRTRAFWITLVPAALLIAWTLSIPPAITFSRANIIAAILYTLIAIVAATLVASIWSPSPAIRQLMAPLTRWKVRWQYYAFAFLFVPATWVVGIMIAHFTGTQIPPLSNEFPHTLTFVVLGWANAILVSTSPPEEGGWRGFLQPELQKKYSPLITGLILGIIWGLWHAPFYYNGETPGGLAGLGFQVFYTIGTAILFTWIYNRTRSMVITYILHAVNDGAAGLLPLTGLEPIPYVAFLIYVVIKDRMWKRLAPEEVQP